MMLKQIINNFYYARLIYIVLLVLFTYSFIHDLKKKDKLNIREYLNIKNFNMCIMLRYLFLSFIIKIILDQVFKFIPFTTKVIDIPSNFYEIGVEFIATCIFAPVFEEIIFRFGVYKKISKKLNIKLAMIITSVIFSLIHFYSIDGIIILIMISLVWNYLFYKTDNLIYPILLHFFHNVYALSDNLLGFSYYWYILLFINILGYIITVKKQKN